MMYEHVAFIPSISNEYERFFSAAKLVNSDLRQMDAKASAPDQMPLENVQLQGVGEWRDNDVGFGSRRKQWKEVVFTVRWHG